MRLKFIILTVFLVDSAEIFVTTPSFIAPEELRIHIHVH